MTLQELLVQELPSLILWLKAAFVRANPGQPLPTDAEVLAAYETAFAASATKDDQILAGD